MSAINLSKHRARVAAQTEIEREHAKAYALLPKGEQALYQATQRLVADLSCAHRGKTLDIEVVKSYLYSKGLSDSWARTALWNAAAHGVIHFDRDFNIECGEFEELD